MARLQSSTRYQSKGIPTTLSILAGTGRYQLFPYQTEVNHLSEAVQGDTTTPYVAQVYPGDTNTSVNTAERLTYSASALPPVQNLTLIQR